MSTAAQPHVVIVGGGFGGLYAAQSLGNRPVRVTLVDRRNFHLFQPLLYQVATGGLSPEDIASPLRSVLRHFQNIATVMDTVVDIDIPNRQVILQREPPMAYDMLVLAAGGTINYFGHDGWAVDAPGLKTVEDALEMRQRIFSAFEAAEMEEDPQKRAALMTFIIVGGGPTGVELAGAIAELTRFTFEKEFRRIDPRQASIVIIEAAPRILSAYPEDLARQAANSLARRGVLIRESTMVTDIRDDCITVQCNDDTDTIPAYNILWGAGVKPSPLAAILADQTGCPLDRAGRVVVEPDLSVPGHPEIFVIGDMAAYTHTPDGRALPGVAAVAMQQGRYVAHLIEHRCRGRAMAPFRYKDKGSLAVIGLKDAVADLGRLRLKGFLAWLIWAFVHIRYLIEFDNKLIVMFQWAWALFTRKSGARLITPG